MKLFVMTIMNGLTLAALYFLVASGFTLVFGLMRNVNLAHGALYLLGAYVGFDVAEASGSWLWGMAAGFVSIGVLGLALQVLVFRFMEGDDLRQTLVTIGLSIVLADIMLAVWGGMTYQFEIPDALYGVVRLPLVKAYTIYRLFILLIAVLIGLGLWFFLNKTRIGIMIRAGVDDRDMLAATGVNVHRLFAVVFAVGAGLAGLAGVVGGSALSIAPGEDLRYLLASLVVVIVGGMGSVGGAAVGAPSHWSCGAVWSCLFTHIRRCLYIHYYGAGPCLSAPRASWKEGRMTTRNSKAESSARSSIMLWHLITLGFLLVYPSLASPFWIVQIGAQSLILGIVALSMAFLAGYGGMVSLAQLSVAGCAGYMLAVLGVNSFNMGLGWHWPAAVIAAIMIATLFGTLIGAISVRTEGIYTIMITLAIAVGFYYFARQNYSILNGYNGFAGLKPPVTLGVNWRDPVPFYYLSLGVAAIAYFTVVYLSRSTFGLSLQGIRDNDRRMRALGYNVNAHRILGYAVAANIAAFGGVLMIWLNGRISPGSISIGPTIDILVIAVIGGLGHPVGPFIGAVLFTLLENFAIDLIAGQRFNLLIGSVFLAIVLFSPDGILGLLGKLKKNHEGPSR